jgi:hypothetical protein
MTARAFGAVHNPVHGPEVRRVLELMSGLAAGRLLSLLVDGWPSPMLMAYAVVELVHAA